MSISLGTIPIPVSCISRLDGVEEVGGFTNALSLPESAPCELVPQHTDATGSDEGASEEVSARSRPREMRVSEGTPTFHSKFKKIQNARIKNFAF